MERERGPSIHIILALLGTIRERKTGKGVAGEKEIKLNVQGGDKKRGMQNILTLHSLLGADE